MKRHLAIAVIAIAALSYPGLAAAAEKPSSPKTAVGLTAAENGDYKTAFRVFNSQAAKGDPEAQFELGMLYALGKGVKKDFVKAYIWTEIAARQKEPYADFIRDEVAANMSPAEIRNAKKRANAWIRNSGKAVLIPVAK